MAGGPQCPRGRLEPELAAGHHDRRAADLDLSARSREPSARAKSVLGRPISAPWRISISSPKAMRPWRARWKASGPAAEPVAGSSGTPWPGTKARVFQRRPAPAKQFVVIPPSRPRAPKSGARAATATSLASVT
jgi:hypothetical protein